MIFAGGYNLKKRKFFQNFKYILIFGVFGTIISFFVIFSLTYLINKLEWIKKWDDSQTVILSTVFIIKFSATICATDSVAALTLIKPA
jgi:NhaP-type Na+/H+ or K+/H+ antiporter